MKQKSHSIPWRHSVPPVVDTPPHPLWDWTSRTWWWPRRRTTPSDIRVRTTNTWRPKIDCDVNMVAWPFSITSRGRTVLCLDNDHSVDPKVRDRVWVVILERYVFVWVAWRSSLDFVAMYVRTCWRKKYHRHDAMGTRDPFWIPPPW